MSKSKKMMRNLLLLPKVFLILTVIFIMWVFILLSPPMFGVFDPDWAGLSPSLWLILLSVLIGVFIVIDIILYATPSFFATDLGSDSGAQPVEFPEVEQRMGKDVYEFTYPVGAKGGVFSKTYIQIKDNAIIRVRNQMIKKDDVWKK